MSMIQLTNNTEKLIREIVNKKPTFREFQEIYRWIRNDVDSNHSEAIELACKITSVIRSKD